MWKRSLLVAALAALFAVQAGAQAPELPAGTMRAKARGTCLACHDSYIIVQQQLSPAAWTTVVDKMIRWGAPVNAPDRQPLIDYLAKNFPPRQTSLASVALKSEAGVEKVRGACLSCHDADLIAGQQLSRAGWTTVLDTMALWGMQLTPGDREAVLNYLARNYSPPPRSSRRQKK